MIDHRLVATLPRPNHFTGAHKDFTLEDLEWVVGQFQVSGPIHVEPYRGRGNINLHTYYVRAGERDYLLQLVNENVFAMPYRVMKAMKAVLDAQWSCLEEGTAPLGWTPIELVPTFEGKDFLDLTDEHGWSVWRLMILIPDTVSYKSLSEVGTREGQLALAEEVGRGLAIYHDLTAEVPAHLIEGSLPGYRDTGLYYRQLHSVLAGNRTLGDAAALLPDDPVLRTSVERHFCVALPDSEFEARVNDPEVVPFIRLALEQEPKAMGLWTALAQGRIRRTLIHGDTKIENFLFCAHSGRVKSLVDLDTIMPFTWLADWGDMVRSMANVAGEKERDLSQIQVDEEVVQAVARGFLSESKGVTEQEVSLMMAAVQAIALELGVRFLADYLRGDTYFMLGPDDPADLNKVRALVQLTLFQRLQDVDLRLA